MAGVKGALDHSLDQRTKIWSYHKRWSLGLTESELWFGSFAVLKLFFWMVHAFGPITVSWGRLSSHIKQNKRRWKIKMSHERRWTVGDFNLVQWKHQKSSATCSKAIIIVQYSFNSINLFIYSSPFKRKRCTHLQCHDVRCMPVYKPSTSTTCQVQGVTARIRDDNKVF